MFSTLLACTVLISLNTFHFASSATAKRNVDMDDLPIKYPGPAKGESLTNRYSVNDVPEECRGKTYCTVKPNDYPEDRYNDMFKAFKGAPSPPVLEDSPPTIGNRQGDPDEKDDCESLVTYDRLYKVKDKNSGDWRTVVQAPKSDYVQRVRLETCKNPEASCFTSFMATTQYSTICKQKYNTWEVVVDDGNGGTEKIKTQLPVCCSCHYKTTSITSRLQSSNQQ